jgi:transcription elongation GreA/GreB family factor
VKDEIIPNAFPTEEWPHREVQLGSRVRLRDAHGGEEEYTIVRGGEADPGRGRISAESPVGRAVLGTRPGDEVRVTTPDGIRTVTVVDLVAPQEWESTAT